MNTKLSLTKVITTLTATSMAFTVATSSIALGARPLLNSNVSQTGVLVGGGGWGSEPDLGPDDPLSAPRKPGQPSLVKRTASDITFRWQDNASYEHGFKIYRGTGFSDFGMVIATIGSVPGNSQVLEYTDAGLPRDTGYYYRVVAYNTHGESASLPQAFATIDGRVQVSRLQFHVRTANVSDANTDDDIHVSVNDYNMNHGTWLDYGQNDFERGKEFTYDLLPEGVADLSDINDLYIFKTGSDGWCVDSISLLVNGGVIYTENFSPCRWFDNSGGSQNHYVVGRDTLRAHPFWQTFVSPLRTSIPKLSLGDFIEGIVGNIIHDDIALDSPVYIGNADPDWGGVNADNRGVNVSGKDSTAVHVGFGLDVDILGPDNLAVDISFDVRFTGVCRTATQPPAIRPTIENIDARSRVTSHTLPTSFLIELATGWAEDMIEENLNNFIPKIERDFPVDADQINCIMPSVDAQGNIDFTLTFVPRTGGTRTPVTGTLGGTVTTSTETSVPRTTGTIGRTGTRVLSR